MKFDDAFYNGFKDELQKEAIIQGLALASRIPTIARIGKGIISGAKAVSGVGKAGLRAAATGARKIPTLGKGLYSRMRSAASTAAQNIPFMGGGGSRGQQQPSSTYV